MSEAWPTELRVTGSGGVLRVAFDDGAVVDLPAELLRVRSPSAEVQGHAPAERKVLGGKRHVRIVLAEPVGNYAVKLGFDDGHDTGLFTWSFLRQLGETQEDVMAAYVSELEKRGLSRDVG